MTTLTDNPLFDEHDLEYPGRDEVRSATSLGPDGYRQMQERLEIATDRSDVPDDVLRYIRSKYKRFLRFRDGGAQALRLVVAAERIAEHRKAQR